MAPVNASAPVRFVRRNRGRARTLEAMALLVVGTTLRRWVPMRYWSFLLGRPGDVPEAWRGRAVPGLRRTEPPSAVERVVVQAVARGRRRLPGAASCLAQALAGQVMLRRRRAPGVVVIGLNPRGTGDRWAAHAWLLGATGPLLGMAESPGFTPATVFEVRSGPPAERCGGGRPGRSPSGDEPLSGSTDW